GGCVSGHEDNLARLPWLKEWKQHADREHQPPERVLRAGRAEAQKARKAGTRKHHEGHLRGVGQQVRGVHSSTSSIARSSAFRSLSLSFVCLTRCRSIG